MTTSDTVRMLTRYKAWADGLIFPTVAALPDGEATKERRTRFGNIVHTLNHIHVIDCIFQAHIEGREHGFTARNTAMHPPLGELWQAVQAMDRWYVDLSDELSDVALAEAIRFRFVDGGEGIMTRGEMIMHVVNHATYHRGIVSEMLYQVPVSAPATDLPVFLRDAPRSHV
jgi:uncharacterized damage-inducible protein DinB